MGTSGLRGALLNFLCMEFVIALSSFARLVITTEILRSSLSSALALEVRSGPRQGCLLQLPAICARTLWRRLCRAFTASPRRAREIQRPFGPCRTEGFFRIFTEINALNLVWTMASVIIRS